MKLNIEKRQRILSMFKMPDEWFTTGEVAARGGICRELAVYYLHDLQRAGFIARCGKKEGNGGEYVWRQKSRLIAGAF